MCTDSQRFNDVVVVGPGNVRAEASITEGAHSIHGGFGRVTERVTSALVATNREALVLANHFLDFAIPCRGELSPYILVENNSRAQWTCRAVVT